MDEDQQYERFDMDNDYEDFTMVGGEAFYGDRRRKRTQDEDDRIYGVFKGESDSEDEGPKRRKGPRQKDDYAKPVSFVSTGRAVEGSDASDSNKEMLEESKATPAATGTGLSFNPAQPAVEAEEVEEEVLPSAFGKRVMEGAKQRQARGKALQAEKKQAQGAIKPLAGFELHTKGMGSKLMAMMGYKEGQGLGRNSQGRAAPIEARMRPKTMGLGHNDYEEQQPAARPKPEEHVKPKEEGKAMQPKLWKKKNAAAGVKREYLSAEDVLSRAAEGPSAAVQQPVLDMRGPQTRLVTNLEHLNVVEESAAGDETPMPELQHNLRLLVDLAEAEIQRLDGKLRHQQDTAVILGREQDRLAQELGSLQSQEERLAFIHGQVAQCRPGTPLQELALTYQGLWQACREEYIMYNLAVAALSQVLPRLSAHMASWQPLVDPTRGTAAFTEWRPLLEGDANQNAVFQERATDDSNPYVRLASAAVLPLLAGAITNEWEPHSPESLLLFMEAWAELLPSHLLRHILDNLVFPKLRVAVEAWEPRVERVPLHAWLHPWLPLLSARLADLYPGIRYKLATALQQWHPSDGSAKQLLSPWHAVFGAKDWAALMAASIVPRLGAALQQELVLSPAAPSLAPWHWAVAWAPLLPPALLVGLLESAFFPQWHAVLHHWLAHAPNYDQVTSWYLGWKAMIPAEIQDHERIRAQTNAALNAMNSAVDGRPLPLQHAPYAAGATGHTAAAPAPSGLAASRWVSGAGARAGTAPSVTEPTLRQLVERFAEDCGIELLPKAGRRQDGLQVYAFGPISIIMDATQGMVQANLHDKWVPMSLDQLVQQAATRPR